MQDNVWIMLEYKLMYVWILLYCFHRIYACRKNFIDYTNLFSRNNYKKNEKIIYIYFKEKYDRRSKSGV